MSEELIEEKEKKLDDIKKEAEERACAVQRALYFINEFLGGPMCGKCYPCALGTHETKIRLIRISQHLEGVSEKDIDAVKRIGSRMIEASFCKKGKDTGRFLTETLATSEDEFREHVYGACPKKECVSLIEYVINPELCIICGKCTEVCKYGAIVGEKRRPHLLGYLPFEIRQKRCTKCGECVRVCPTGAIEIITSKIEEMIQTAK
ncbi:MAG: 4Fe-4S binding protein [Nitrospirota bacterium]